MALALGARPQLPNVSRGRRNSSDVANSAKNLELLAANLSSGLGGLRPRSVLHSRSTRQSGSTVAFPQTGHTLLDEELGFQIPLLEKNAAAVPISSSLRDVFEERQSHNTMETIIHSRSVQKQDLGSIETDLPHSAKHSTRGIPRKPMDEHAHDIKPLQSYTPPGGATKQEASGHRPEGFAGTQQARRHTDRIGYPAYGPPDSAALFALPSTALPPMPPQGSAQPVIVRSPRGKGRSRSPSAGRGAEAGSSQPRVRITSHPAAGQEYQPPGLRGFTSIPVADKAAGTVEGGEYAVPPIPGMLLRGSGSGGGKKGTFSAQQVAALSEEQRRVAERVSRASLAAARAFTSTLPVGATRTGRTQQETGRENLQPPQEQEHVQVHATPVSGYGSILELGRPVEPLSTGEGRETLPDRISEGLIRDLLLMAATVRSQSESDSVLSHAQSRAQWDDPARAFPLTLDRALMVLRSPLALQQELEGHPQYTQPEYITSSTTDPTTTVVSIPSAGTVAGPVVPRGVHRVGTQPLQQGLDALGPPPSTISPDTRTSSQSATQSSSRSKKKSSKPRVRPVSAVELASGWGPAHDQLYSHIVLQLPRLVAEGVVQMSRGLQVQPTGSTSAGADKSSPLPHPGLVLAVAFPLLSSLQEMLCDLDVVTLLREAVATKVQERLARALNASQASPADGAPEKVIAPVGSATVAPAPSVLAVGVAGKAESGQHTEEESQRRDGQQDAAAATPVRPEGGLASPDSPHAVVTAQSPAALSTASVAAPADSGGEDRRAPTHAAVRDELSEEYNSEQLEEEAGFYSASDEEYVSDEMEGDVQDELEEEEEEEDTDF